MSDEDRPSGAEGVGPSRSPAPAPDDDGASAPAPVPGGPAPVLNYASLGQEKRVQGMVTVATFGAAWEAHLAAGKLEAEGIPCLIADENMATTYGGVLGVALGGIKLQVPVGDAERARAALPARVRGQVHACPSCGSSDTKEVSLTPVEALVCLLLLGIPYLFMPRRFWCLACGNRWKAARYEEPEQEDEEKDEG